MPDEYGVWATAALPIVIGVITALVLALYSGWEERL